MSKSATVEKEKKKDVLRKKREVTEVEMKTTRSRSRKRNIDFTRTSFPFSSTPPSISQNSSLKANVNSTKKSTGRYVRVIFN